MRLLLCFVSPICVVILLKTIFTSYNYMVHIMVFFLRVNIHHRKHGAPTFLLRVFLSDGFPLCHSASAGNDCRYHSSRIQTYYNGIHITCVCILHELEYGMLTVQIVIKITSYSIRRFRYATSSVADHVFRILKGSYTIFRYSERYG